MSQTRPLTLRNGYFFLKEQLISPKFFRMCLYFYRWSETHAYGRVLCMTAWKGEVTAIAHGLLFIKKKRNHYNQLVMVSIWTLTRTDTTSVLLSWSSFRKRNPAFTFNPTPLIFFSWNYKFKPTNNYSILTKVLHLYFFPTFKSISSFSCHVISTHHLLASPIPLSPFFTYAYFSTMSVVTFKQYQASSCACIYCQHD